jgi:hypothetical protein
MVTLKIALVCQEQVDSCQRFHSLPLPSTSVTQLRVSGALRFGIHRISKWPVPTGGFAPAQPLESCQNALGHRSAPCLEPSTAAPPPEHTFEFRSRILEFPGSTPGIDLAQCKQCIVEREATPATLSISVLLEECESTGQALLPPG